MALHLSDVYEGSSDWSVSAVGGKAFALRELDRIGVPVPSGVAMSTRLLRECLQTESLINVKAEIAIIPDVTGVIAACERYRRLSESREAPRRLNFEIDKAIRLLRGSRFAVRSSAVQEDGLHWSWAGQFDSFLDVEPSGVKRKVVSCWTSLVSARSVFYGRKIDVALATLDIGVLIQKFVPAVVSGVAFTRHPVEKDASIIYVEAVLGSGEKLVSGAVIPDTYVISKRNGRVLSALKSDIASTERQRSVSGIPSPLPKPLRRPVLTNENINAIVRLCAIVERHFGCPQDIEFAVWQDQIYILQSRPITS